MSNDLFCYVLNKLSVIKNLSLKMCAKNANSKDLRFFKCSTDPQIESAYDSFIIASKTALKLIHSFNNKCKIVDLDGHLVCTN